ncbi:MULTISPECIES: M81 family metallopeptidase [unclassified Herbaspirillum]|nr:MULTISPECIES: M81 family metallopeptidase [unclassified Herbaspirillum]RFB72857.1 M81 family peptidase [Herbaspirillum sp. 3R-3a1]TFI11336.1 M81 family peptidase [Herbaspirillum sp. 3R11]TFI17244.1 M81 family peptidase [Herbaspirillum sp. 3R-11]
MRIAIGGFQHETNTFSPTPTTWADFAAADTWPGLLEGEALLTGMSPAPGSAPSNIPIAGFIAAARQTAHTLIPIVWCAAGPSGRVTRDAFERIVGMLTDGIARVRPEAVYLDLHGAMAAEHIDDADGEILQRVRALVGADVPIIASLDLHANVSQKMIEHADVLVAYRTYPHVDMAATGARAFNWIARRLAGVPRPHAAWLRAPYLIPMCWQCTDDAPARDLYALLDHIDAAGEDSASFTMGFPAADVEKCGPAVWAYGASAQSAQDAAQGLLDAVNAVEAQFNGEIFSAQDAVAHAIATGRDNRDKSGPVVIADAQDNPGAGGSADTTTLLKALIAGDAKNAVLGLLVDPHAAQRAHAAGAGARLSLSLGGKSGIAGDSPLEAEFLVERLHDGDVTATGSVFSGYQLTLGLSALLAIGGVRVIVVSKPVQLLDLALLRFIGIEPSEQAIIAVKSTVHFRADFAPIAGKILICAAPGAFPLDPRQLAWTRLPEWMRRMPAAR